MFPRFLMRHWSMPMRWLLERLSPCGRMSWLTMRRGSCAANIPVFRWMISSRPHTIILCSLTPKRLPAYDYAPAGDVNISVISVRFVIRQDPGILIPTRLSTLFNVSLQRVIFSGISLIRSSSMTIMYIVIRSTAENFFAS